MNCEICNKEFLKHVSLSNHISRVHNLKVKEYYDKFIKLDGENECLHCKSTTTFHNLERGYRRYCSYKCLNNSDSVKQKKKNTCLQNFGVDNPNKSEEIKNKKIKTCSDNFGVINPSKSKEIKNKKIQTYLRNYGVSNYSKTPEARLKFRNLLISRIVKKYGSINPRVGISEEKFFVNLKKLIQYPILLNQYLIGYYPDGRIEDLKLIIEFDEPEHFIRDWYKEKDVQKDLDYRVLGYQVYRIKETDWIHDPDLTIKNCIQFIEGISI